MGNPTYAAAVYSKLRNVRVWSSDEEKKIEELCDYKETGQNKKNNTVQRMSFGTFEWLKAQHPRNS